LHPEYNRISSDDYPTFKGMKYSDFNQWLLKQIKYPKEAKAKKLEGIVRASMIVQPDGKAAAPGIIYSSDKVFEKAVIKAISSSPAWTPAKNPEANEPYKVTILLNFALPDRIYIPEEPFVVVEEMPVFPGGEEALLNYISSNIRYPESAKRNLISGRVIVRFVINQDGKVEQASVIRGADPLIDAEALRVVNTLPAFKPGYQGGKPVPVWYMVPVTFSLTEQKPAVSGSSPAEIQK
jgi:TonB family protein